MDNSGARRRRPLRLIAVPGPILRPGLQYGRIQRKVPFMVVEAGPAPRQGSSAQQRPRPSQVDGMGQKRKAQEAPDAAGDGPGPSEEFDEAEQDDGLTPYERQRAALIEMNRQRMIALGIPAAVAGLSRLAAAKPKAPRKKRVPRPPQEPSRQSSRLRGETAHTDATDLALFVINEACPRCGKVQTKMQKQHLEQCTAVRPEEREPGDEVDDDAAEDEEADVQLAQIHASKEAERVQRMDAKLKSLQLDGLVDIDDQAAKFVVLGSTKKHYNVVLSDEAQTCQCVDFCVRKHACKHIRLVLTQLDIADQPAAWREAVKRKIGEALHAGQ